MASKPPGRIKHTPFQPHNGFLFVENDIPFVEEESAFFGKIQQLVERSNLPIIWVNAKRDNFRRKLF